jgi:AcrR family transcriptional regulator
VAKEQPESTPGRQIGRPFNADGVVTRRLIVTAAVRQLGAVGYERMTLESVANEAGITRAAIYRYFDSKRELARAAVQAGSPNVEGMDVLYESLAVDAKGLPDQVRALVVACIQNIIGDPWPSLGYFQLGKLADHDEELAKLFRVRSRYIRNKLTEIVRAAADRGELIEGANQHAIVDAMSGLIWAMTLGVAEAPTERVKDQIAMAVELLLQDPPWLARKTRPRARRGDQT